MRYRINEIFFNIRQGWSVIHTSAVTIGGAFKGGDVSLVK